MEGFASCVIHRASIPAFQHSSIPTFQHPTFQHSQKSPRNFVFIQLTIQRRSPDPQQLGRLDHVSA